MSDRVIDVRGLRMAYGDVEAVRGVDLHVDRGEVFALLGPNGAGKTTTLRLLTALGHPTAGSAVVGGIPIADGGPELASRIGYLDQEPPGLIAPAGDLHLA